ncbi:YphA family membrane protein [Gracilibacillus alcaliphilus]|uniref:YphA family membrane protein n=1 Tax=Gracilibacillus alcaliphilus TaxID=1401441 RepID=UPI003B83039A
MQLYYTIYIAWVLWCLVTFFMKRSTLQYRYAVGLLMFIILLPYEVIIYQFPIRLAFLFLLCFSWALIIRLKLTWKQYGLIIMIGYLYSIYFIWRLTNPIFTDRFFIATAVILGFLIISICVRTLDQRISLAISGVCFGQLLYSLICHSYHLQYTIEPLYSFQILLTILLLLAVQQVWKYYAEKMEQQLQVIKMKKRWHV